MERHNLQELHALLSYCETDVLVCGTHLPAHSMGHVVSRDNSFWFQFQR